MKNILMIIGGVFIIFSIMSYTATNGNTYANYTTVVPLKQKGIFVTTDYAKVNKLIKKGWIVQDVDITGDGYHGHIQNFYTLIKY
jgi:hypothetical protein